MMKFVAVASFLLFVTTAVSQNTFTLNRPSVEAIRSVEASNKGNKFRYNFPVSLATGYFPGSESFKLAQPVPYTRETTPIKTTIEYYFSVPDSVIRLIEYSWNTRDDKLVELNKVFDSNAKILSKYFRNEGTTTSENHSDWSQKTIVWQDDVVHAKQFIVIGNGTNKVRVLVSWKNQ